MGEYYRFMPPAAIQSPALCFNKLVWPVHLGSDRDFVPATAAAPLWSFLTQNGAIIFWIEMRNNSCLLFFYISVRIVCSISCTEGNLLGSGTSQWFLVLHLRQLPALIFQSLLKHYSNYPPLLSITSLTSFLTFFLFAVSGATGTRRAESRSIPQDLCRRLNRPLWTVADWAHQKDQSRQAQNHRRWHSRCRGVSFGFLLCFEMYLPAAYTLPSILKCKCTSTFFFLREQRWNKEAQNRGDMRSPGFAPTMWKQQSTVLDKAAKGVQTCSDLKRCVFSAFPW